MDSSGHPSEVPVSSAERNAVVRPRRHTRDAPWQRNYTAAAARSNCGLCLVSRAKAIDAEGCPRQPGDMGPTRLLVEHAFEKANHVFVDRWSGDVPIARKIMGRTE